MVAVIVLVVSVSFEWLAESTSLATLAVFALVNLALIKIHVRHIHTHRRHVRVPTWFPVLGFATCVAMIGSALLR